MLTTTIVPSDYFSSFDRILTCMNDGTVRKAELRKTSNTVFVSGGSSGFSNITKALLYGVMRV